MKARVPALTPAQKQSIREECANEFSKLVSNYNRRAAVQVLHILRFNFNFGEERLKKFAELLSQMQKEAVDRYEISNKEIPDICEIQLRDSGVNVDKFL